MPLGFFRNSLDAFYPSLFLPLFFLLSVCFSPLSLLVLFLLMLLSFLRFLLSRLSQLLTSSSSSFFLLSFPASLCLPFSPLFICFFFRICLLLPFSFFSILCSMPSLPSLLYSALSSLCVLVPSLFLAIQQSGCSVVRSFSHSKVSSSLSPFLCLYRSTGHS